MFTQLGVIGCGLMGGSFALALKRAGMVQRVVGYSKSPSTTEKAKRLGVIDIAAESALLAVSGSDIVLVAVPVAASLATFRSIRHVLAPHQLIMDVGSTKGDVIAAAREGLKDMLPNFVPAHPVAGRETSGVEHADPDLYRGRMAILTPLAETNPALLQRASLAWQAVGSKVMTMTADNHDAAFAAVSHLPHLLAFAYFKAILEQDAAHDLLALAGPGFRDFTRIAASDPAVWRDILLANRKEVLVQLRHLKKSLGALEAAMIDGKGSYLEQEIHHIAEARSQWQISGARRDSGGTP